MQVFRQHLASSVSTAAFGLALSLGLIAQGQPPSAVQAKTPDPPEVSRHDAQQAEEAYLTGVKLLDRGDLAKAEKQFLKASNLVPSRTEYVQATALAHEHRVTELVQQAGRARMLGHPDKADSLLAEARKLDPQNEIVTQHTNAAQRQSIFHPEIRSGDGVSYDPLDRRIRQIAGPITLSPSKELQEFHLHADSRQIVEQVFSRYNIRTVFDDSVERKDIRLELEKVPYSKASSIVLDMAHAFATPVDPQTVLIAKDNTENREKLEHQLQETIYVPGFTPAQMKELGTVVQSVFDVKKTSIQSNGGSISIRAPEETLSAINLTLADLVDGGSEVLLDINLYAVDRTRQRNIGVQLPQQIGVYNAESAARDLVNANQDLVNQAIAQGLIPADANNITIALALISSGLVQSSLLANTIGFFGGGLTTSGVTLNASTTINLALSSSDVRALDTIKLRLGDRETGSFRSGTRYPIITSTYTSATAGTSLAGATVNGVNAQDLINQASSSVTIPQIQFEDLGLTLKATPTIQKSGQVTMQLDLKIEALGTVALNNIPVLAQRQYASTVTVGDGESALLASSLSRTESAAVSGLPGLSELPGFQTATANKTTETDSSELVLLITPHVVRHRRDNIAGPRIPYEQRLPD
jgi:Flp pilus assembly secretin CpaC